MPVYQRHQDNHRLLRIELGKNIYKKQERIGQERTGEDRKGQERTGKGKITCWTWEDRKGQERTGEDRKGQERTGKDRKGQERTGKDRKGQERIKKMRRKRNGCKNVEYIVQDVAEYSVRWREHKQLTGLYLFYIDWGFLCIYKQHTLG